MKTLLYEITAAAVEDTERAGADFAASLPKGELTFVAMYGDLGAGKTAFVRGMASFLTPGAAVSSPTFALVNAYEGERTVLYHFDMYRITSDDDLYSIGFYDYLEPDRRYPTCVIAAEWCENIPHALPPCRYEIRIDKDGDTRHIAVSRVEEV